MNNKAITNGAVIESQLRLLDLKPLKNKELETTETELKAIARPADEVIFMASYERAKILEYTVS